MLRLEPLLFILILGIIPYANAGVLKSSYTLPPPVTESPAEDSLINRLVANGPINNDYDAFLIFNLQKVNNIYRKAYKDKILPLQPFTAHYNLSRDGINVRKPELWRAYDVHLTFTNPQFEIESDGHIKMTQQLYNGSYFIETHKIDGRVKGKVAAIEVKNSTVDIEIPELPIDFHSDFVSYWHEKVDNEFYVLGKIGNTPGEYDSLVPYDFNVCTIPDAQMPMILVVINTLTSKKNVTLTEECYKLLPQHNDLYSQMIPSGKDVSLFLSSRNMGKFLAEVMTKTMEFHSVEHDDKVGKFTKAVAPALYDAIYTPPNKCRMGPGWNSYSTSCAGMLGGEERFQIAPDFKTDQTKEGTSTYEFGFLKSHEVYGCSLIGAMAFQQAICHCCADKRGSCHLPLSETMASLLIALDAQGDNLKMNATIVPSVNNKVTSDCFSMGVQSSPIKPSENKQAVQNSEKAGEYIPMEFNLLRLSNVLFPECNVMSFDYVKHTPDLAIFGSISEDANCTQTMLSSAKNSPNKQNVLRIG
eukprot:Nk52_evm39s232 gene=Nk52_evmTU39s232